MAMAKDKKERKHTFGLILGKKDAKEVKTEETKAETAKTGK